MTELINAKRNGSTIGPKSRPRGENVVDLMDALKKSIAGETSTRGKKPRKASAAQKEMLLPIEGKGLAMKTGLQSPSCERVEETQDSQGHGSSVKKSVFWKTPQE